MRLIDADKLKGLIDDGWRPDMMVEQIWDIVDDAPTVDAVQIVRCKDCIHRPTWEHNSIEFPDDKCPCQCEDCFYSWFPKDDWYCANGERRQDDV